MKSISVSDEAYDALAIAADKKGFRSVTAFIEALPDVREHETREHGRKLLSALEADPIPTRATLKDRFLRAVRLVCECDPTGFAGLEGLTKSDGRAVFVSKSDQLIVRTSESGRPEPIGDSGYYLNVQGGHKDFVQMIEIIREKLGLPPGCAGPLKKAIGPSEGDTVRELAKFA